MEFPADFFPTEGFVKQAHPLYVRVFFIDEETPFALVSIEMTSLSDEECARIKKETAILLGIGENQVWVAATHTFSAPHILPDFALKTEEEKEKRTLLQRTLGDAIRAAVWQAKQEAAESELTLYQGETSVIASRDIELADGWWIGCGGTGPSDKTLTVLEIKQEGKTKAMLLHANVQSSILDGTGAKDGKCVSGDLAGIACAELEKRYPGASVMFMIGAAGDQAPIKRAKGYAPDGQNGYVEIDLHEDGIPLAETLGEKLAAEAMDALRKDGVKLNGQVKTAFRSFYAPAKKMNRNLRELKPTHSCEWELDGEKEQAIELFALGDLAIVGVKPELGYPTLRQLREASPYPITLVATMINGGAKYMADQSAYDKCMYEAINSPFAPGAAEMLVKEAAAMMKR
ncbi:MAG: hypothetical protein IJ214_09190, partial [Clostridia bacterium]|nr:hypothetical protein [Clostridia bacterium]